MGWFGAKLQMVTPEEALPGRSATMPVASGLTSNRGWMAEAMAVEPHELLARFQDAAANPLPWQEVGDAPVQEVVHRKIDLLKSEAQSLLSKLQQLDDDQQDEEAEEVAVNRSIRLNRAAATSAGAPR